MITIKIYTLKNPLTNEIFYVGKTIDLDVRLLQHISSSIKNDKPKDVIIKELIKKGLHPIIEEIDSIECIYQEDEDAASELEYFWMQQLRCWGYNLVNIDGLNKPYKYARRFSKDLEKSLYQKCIEYMDRESDRLCDIREKIEANGELSETEKKKLRNRISEQYHNAVINLFTFLKEDDMVNSWIKENDLMYFTPENRYIFCKNYPNYLQVTLLH